MNFEKIKNTMIKFLEEEANKIGIKNVIVGISGGLDSAIVAVLAQEVFKDGTHGVLMPSHYSSDSSINDAKELCDKFNISYEIISIEPMVKAYEQSMGNDKLRIGNFSARMRMAVLYDLSSKYNGIVIGTGNKSEILLGYGTIYGDTACAINPLGEIYKSDEFEFARFLGIPQSIIDKKPSADLWENQSDEDELGYTYKELDDIMKQLIDNQIPKQTLIDNKVSQKAIEMIEDRIRKNSFKGKMPPIATLGQYYKG